MAETSIDWTSSDDGTPGVVWNPSTGCDRISPGCDNCYALTLAKRLKGMGSAKYQNDGDPRTSGPGFGITEHPDTRDAPLRWRKPRKVFVNSMSDLFHTGVSDEFIARVFAVMADASQHTFQILTKRHGRLRSLLNDGEFFQEVRGLAIDAHGVAGIPWPLPNVWIGVSVEDQKRADLRIPALLDTPAAVRWLSCEPLIGPVHLSLDWLGGRCCPRCGGYWDVEDSCGPDHEEMIENPQGIGWVVVGGESGAGFRPMDLEAARSLVGKCQRAGVPVWVKQDSGLRPGMQGRIPDEWWIKQFPG
jgi:protein gp37